MGDEVGHTYGVESGGQGSKGCSFFRDPDMIQHTSGDIKGHSPSLGTERTGMEILGSRGGAWHGQRPSNLTYGEAPVIASLNPHLPESLKPQHGPGHCQRW